MTIFGVGIVALAVTASTAVQFLSGSGSPDPVPPLAQPANRSDRPAAGEAMADRPEETVQALANNQEMLNTRVEGISDTVATGFGGLREQIQQIGSELTALKTDQTSLAETAGTETELNRLREELLGSMQAMLNDFETRVGPDYPVGGSPGQASRGVPGADGYLWYSAAAPDFGSTGLEGGLAAFPERLGELTDSPSAPRKELPPAPVPAYTIPADATLVRSRGLTALIGRVPNQGQLVDPFPFKVITGRDNLLANGQVLPEFEQAIWSGVAAGDATLHCVTGKLTQVTFIFQDGTISTWPGEVGDTDSRGIGWISNEQGFPCFPGKFVSNLQQNIAGITSATFASSLARAWSEQQTTTTRDGTAVTRSVTGNPGEYALGQGIAGGINEWAGIIAERAREAFDAVVVPPGQTLTVHVAQAIPIDWPPAGRRVRHVTSLDGHGAMEKPGGLD